MSPFVLQFPRLIAHRGDRAYAPENTLPAFLSAADKGAQWVEFDATLCAGETSPVIIFHDDTIERTTNGGAGALLQTDFEQLRCLDAGSWFDSRYKGVRVPTLIEVMDFCTSRAVGMNVEIKVAEDTTALDTPEAGFDPLIARQTAERVMTTLLNYAVKTPYPRQGGGLLVSSFSTEALLVAKARAPHMPRGFLLHRPWSDPRDLRGRLEQTQPTTLNLNHEMLQSCADVADYKQISGGLPLLCYTVNDPPRAAELLSWGVDSLFTDDIAALSMVPG